MAPDEAQGLGQQASATASPPPRRRGKNGKINPYVKWFFTRIAPALVTFFALQSPASALMVSSGWWLISTFLGFIFASAELDGKPFRNPLALALVLSELFGGLGIILVAATNPGSVSVQIALIVALIAIVASGTTEYLLQDYVVARADRISVQETAEEIEQTRLHLQKSLTSKAAFTLEDLFDHKVAEARARIMSDRLSPEEKAAAEEELNIFLTHTLYNKTDEEEDQS